MDEQQIRAHMALWSAVVAQAVKEAWSREAGLRLSARRWLTSTDNGPGSWRWYCSFQDWDPDMMASRVLASREAARMVAKREAMQDRRLSCKKAKQKAGMTLSESGRKGKKASPWKTNLHLGK